MEALYAALLILGVSLCHARSINLMPGPDSENSVSQEEHQRTSLGSHSNAVGVTTNDNTDSDSSTAQTTSITQTASLTSSVAQEQSSENSVSQEEQQRTSLASDSDAAGVTTNDNTDSEGSTPQTTSITQTASLTSSVAQEQSSAESEVFTTQQETSTTAPRGGRAHSDSCEFDSVLASATYTEEYAMEGVQHYCEQPLVKQYIESGGFATCEDLIHTIQRDSGVPRVVDPGCLAGKDLNNDALQPAVDFTVHNVLLHASHSLRHALNNATAGEERHACRLDPDDPHCGYKAICQDSTPNQTEHVFFCSTVDHLRMSTSRLWQTIDQHHSRLAELGIAALASEAVDIKPPALDTEEEEEALRMYTLVAFYNTAQQMRSLRGSLVQLCRQ